MDSTLLDIGAQCSLPSCSRHDFLPIFCPKCSKYFCNDHIHSDLHSCPELFTNDGIQHDKLQRCALNDCSKLSLDAYNAISAAACTKCNKSFCAEHRHPISHNCMLTVVPGASTSANRNEKARTLLAKMTSPPTQKTPANRSTKLPTDPSKLAAHRRIELLKMRHKASPLDPKDKAASPPLDQRLHIKVLHGGEEKIFWVRKTLIAGKALDLLCAQLGVRASSPLPVQLLKEEAGSCVLQNDKLMSEQVEDGSTLSISQASHPDAPQ